MPTTGTQLAGTATRAHALEPVRKHLRRAHHQGPPVLLRRLPGLAAGYADLHQQRDRVSHAMALGRFLEFAGPLGSGRWEDFPALQSLLGGREWESRAVPQ